MFSRLQTEQSVALSVYTLSIYCNHRLLRVKRGLVYIVILWSPTFQKFGCDIVTPVLSVYSSILFWLCVHVGAAEDGFSREVIKRTQKHLDQYAREGLRTLCVAKKVCLSLSFPLFATSIIFYLHTAHQPDNRLN